MKPLMYLDPGSGSFIIQMLLAGLLGIAVAIRIYWKKIVAFFRRGKAGDVQDQLDALDEYDGANEIKSEKEDE
ncbi:MAG: hypothetical protein H0S79_12540 [Anaerolineaceae bacterium]|nr:hypothetical protein [Anaerolineaceae bacterium]